MNGLLMPLACLQKDGGVIKKVLVEGASWEKPEEGDKVEGERHAASPTKSYEKQTYTHTVSGPNCKEALLQNRDSVCCVAQCTMSARWRRTAASLTRRASAASPSPSLLGKVPSPLQMYKMPACTLFACENAPSCGARASTLCAHRGCASRVL